MHTAQRNQMKLEVCEYSSNSYRLAVILENLKGPQLVKDYHKI